MQLAAARARGTHRHRRCPRRAARRCSAARAYRRSRIWRLVTNLPSRPASGEVLTWKFIASVGSSTWIGGRPSACSGSQIVRPMFTSSMPVTATMSPAAASSTRRALQALESQHLGDLGGTAILIAVAQRHLATGAQRAAADAADADAADVGVVVERRDLQLQRRIELAAWRRHVLQHRLEQRRHVRARRRVVIECWPSPAAPRHRSPESRAARRWRRACRTARRSGRRPSRGARRGGRSC